MGFMPATPDEVGVIYEYGGLPTERRFGVSGVGYERPAIQIVFRGLPNDYLNPRLKCEIAYKYLMTIQPGSLGPVATTEYLSFDPQQPPHPVADQDGNGRFKIGVNIYIVKGPS